ncbi:MAG: murein DD-endopeptidase MepM/ murein hydrolase activator NlpD [Verrucomicrobiales bacterium]|jgi:murein DD-endopeptidase MepM/ murein hydrolase activator NlpD
MPLSSTFGPRLKASESFRYDFHRGIDLPTPFGTPVYAIADGVVRLAGEYSFYSDPLVQVRHSTDGGGYIYSNSMHLSGWVVNEGDVVSKGGLLGFTGISESGFEHLHFEIRDGGIYQRHCIHPLVYLPYTDTVAHEVSIDSVAHDNSATQVACSVTLPPSELDLNRVEVRVFDASKKKRVLIDEHAFDMMAWNAANEDARLDDNDLEGIVVDPARFNAQSETYEIAMLFYDLVGAPKIAVEVIATDVGGNSVKTSWPAKTRGGKKNR